MTGDQQFVIAIVTQLVVLLVAVVGMVGALLARREASSAKRVAEVTSQKSDRNSAQVQALAVSVDGRLKQLLNEKDERIEVVQRAARAEGKIEGLREAAPAGPVVVEPVVVQAPPPTPAPGQPGPPDRSGRRATDPPAPPANHEPPKPP